MSTHNFCLFQEIRTVFTCYPSYLEVLLFCYLYSKIYLVGTHWNCLQKATPNDL